MASTNNAGLFGDSDSSDESVGATKIAAPASDPAPAKDDVDDTEPATSGQLDGAEADKPQRNAASNANLFGDDDSSDDDEFGGDDGIVGRSAAGDGKAGGAEAEAVVAKPQTMSERLGLDSDSDDDKHESKQGKDGENQPESKPVYVPPRKMELLNLSYDIDTVESDAKKIHPSLHIVKLPNLVGINYSAYNANTHNLEDEEEYYRGYVHNMIRWRYKYNPDDDSQIIRDGEGNPVRESNTRLVKWSDGSYTLHVGQEVLEVDNLDSSVPLDADGSGAVLPGFAGINGYLYVSQKARVRPPSKQEMRDHEDDDMEEDEEDPPAQPAGTVLECLGPIASRFAPRPSSLASEAHRNLTLAVRQRNVKRARIAEIVTDFDPEKEKQARIKGKDDLAKSQTRGGRRSGGGGGRRRGMNASYLEEDEDYEGVNLGRLKRQTMRREYGNEEEDEVMDYGEDSDEEEDEWSKNKKRKRGAALQAARASSASEKVQKKKRGVGNFDEDDESSEEGEVVFGEDDDEEEEGALFKKRAGGGAKKADFLDDDDDE
ncbi:hypothetical protein HJC23_009757 [Cyclotella cryptica]|uniref:RNA polymerase-associated protein LEO1 n=1 Tax=Cyclotella cryptica TaxID=29204 RepID=A0ABD3PS94_9STRA|eukprot:CCRYP_012103-RB/>CCRYP_012103-RB protein AED:0.03 eAED:0.03 QI:140/1/1/1/0.25/0.2/5/1801/543